MECRVDEIRSEEFEILLHAWMRLPTVGKVDMKFSFVFGRHFEKNMKVIY